MFNLNYNNNYKLYNHSGTYRTKEPKATLSNLLNITEKINLISSWEIYPKYINSIHGNFIDPSIYYSDAAVKLIGVKKTSGKGLTNLQAYCSVLAEAVERLSCFSYLHNPAKFIITTEKSLNNKCINLDFIYNCAYSNLLSTILKVKDNREKLSDIYLQWYQGVDLITGKDDLYIPYSLIVFLLHGTNGMAAGNTIEEAILHGLCEVIERDIETRVYENDIVAPTLDLSTIDSNNVNFLIDLLYQDKNDFIIKDFSAFYKVPAFAFLRYIPQHNKYMLTYGCSVSKEDALIRTILENLFLDEFLFPKYKSQFPYFFNNSKVSNYKDIKELCSDNICTELNSVINILYNDYNMKSYMINTTFDNNFPSCFVFIDGMKYNIDFGTPEAVQDIEHRNKNFILGLENKLAVL